MKTVGDKFPAFSLPGIDENNEFVQVDIHESYTPHKKDWSVVYFYPKDFTFVCPTELSDLAENINRDPIIEAALKEGVNRLRKICDPEKINSQCFADQKRRIKELGGREACINSYNFNHTPTPAEQNKLIPS